MKVFEERRDSIRAKHIGTLRHRLFKRHSRRVQSIWQVSTTKNMSLSGLYFLSALAYKIGDIIELNVAMPGSLNIFNGFGKVVRIYRTKSGHYEAAVKYVDLKLK